MAQSGTPRGVFERQARDGSMSKRVRKAIFPVGGLGTRFLPATKAMPKEMLPVVDRPLIQLVVDEARQAGIRSSLSPQTSASIDEYIRFRGR